MRSRNNIRQGGIYYHVHSGPETGGGVRVDKKWVSRSAEISTDPFIPERTPLGDWLG